MRYLISVALLAFFLASPGLALPLCVGAHRHTCVVDGDTLWLEGEKIRLADIDAPEIFSPKCRSEAKRGAAARDRLAELVDADAVASGDDTDKYGRRLAHVRSRGRDVGEVLINEGLARRWTGRRESWCE